MLQERTWIIPFAQVTNMGHTLERKSSQRIFSLLIFQSLEARGNCRRKKSYFIGSFIWDTVKISSNFKNRLGLEISLRVFILSWLIELNQWNIFAEIEIQVYIVHNFPSNSVKVNIKKSLKQIRNFPFARIIKGRENIFWSVKKIEEINKAIEQTVSLSIKE